MALLMGMTHVAYTYNEMEAINKIDLTIHHEGIIYKGGCLLNEAEEGDV